MSYENSYCNYECTVCADVCPTHALKPITKEDVQRNLMRFETILLEQTAKIRRSKESEDKLAEKIFLKDILFCNDLHKRHGKDQILSCELVVCIKRYGFVINLGNGNRNLISVTQLD